MKAAAKKKAKPVAKAVTRSPSRLVAKKPVAKKPVAKKPAAKKPAAKKPAAKKPAVKKPAVKKVVAKKPAAKKVVAKKPAAKKPAAKPSRVNTAPVKKSSSKPVVKTSSGKPATPAASKKGASSPAKAAKPTTRNTVTATKTPAAKKATSHSKAPAPAKTTSKTKTAATAAAVPAVASPAAAPTHADGRKVSARAAKAMSLVPPPPGQSVASTTAKASYSRAESLPPPVVPAAVKKNPQLANNWKSKPVHALSDEEVLAMPDDAYMNDVQLAFFKLRLQQLKQDILNNAGETTEHLREDTVIVPDPADRATIEEEHALELRTRDRERKLLKKIEQSIALIDSGDYGYCDETGEPIGVGRLLARPTATLSLEAQQRRELKQKMFGD